MRSVREAQRSNPNLPVMNRHMTGRGIGAAATLVAVLTLVPAAPAAARPEGDLVYQPTWHVGLEADGWLVGITSYIYDSSGHLAEAASGAPDWVDFYISADVHAQSEDHPVSCHADFYVYWELTEYPEPDITRWIWLGDATDTELMPGAGPDIVAIKISAFIAPQWISDPFGLEGTIFAGDDRSFQNAGDTSRLKMTADAYNTATNDPTWFFEPLFEPGLTIEYDAVSSLDGNGRLTQEAIDDWEPGGDKKLDWRLGDSGGDVTVEKLGGDMGAGTSTERLRCTAWGRNGLLPYSPAFDWDFTITLTYGFNEARFVLEGDHDGFPYYEMYLNGQSVYEFTTDGNILHLYPPMDIHLLPHYGSIDR